MNAQTQAVLNDLIKAGIDVSSIVNQTKVNPILDKQVDNIVGGGILRQAEYTRLSNEIIRKENDYKKQIQELASSHDTLSSLDQNSELYKALLAKTTALEDALVETGLYTEDSIKNVSFKEKSAVEKLITDPPVKAPIIDDNNDNSGKGNNMPNFDPTKSYVDADELQLTTANMATGSILMNMKITAMMDEAKRLGVEVTPTHLDKFNNSFVTNVVRGNKKVEDVFDEVFELSTIRATKATEARTKEITDARAAGRAEALKEMGVPARQITKLGSHSILDSKTIGRASTPTNKNSMLDDAGNIDPTKVPVNDRGEVERYKMRGSKEDRYSRAAASMANVTELLANDPTYIE